MSLNVSDEQQVRLFDYCDADEAKKQQNVYTISNTYSYNNRTQYSQT